MSGSLGVGHLTALLLEERKYDTPLTAKEFHKLLYFVSDELKEEGIPSGVQYFWYKYGTMACTANSPVSITTDGSQSQVGCSIDPSEVELESEDEQRVRLAINRVLNRHYLSGTEGLTDQMYENSPYEFQRYYRYLDKQLTTAINEYPDRLDSGFDQESIRETVYTITDSFPKDEFSEYVDDMLTWYRAISAELDSDYYKPSRAHQISETFWSIISIQLAIKQNTGLSIAEIADEFGRTEEEFLASREDLRSRLSTYEKEMRLSLRQSNPSLIEKRAADAVAVSTIDISW